MKSSCMPRLRDPLVGFAALRGSGCLPPDRARHLPGRAEEAGAEGLRPSWTTCQPSAFWALWRARGQAVQTIRQAGPQLLGLGKRLFAFTMHEPGFYPEEGWALIWQTSNEV